MWILVLLDHIWSVQSFWNIPLQLQFGILWEMKLILWYREFFLFPRFHHCIYVTVDSISLGDILILEGTTKCCCGFWHSWFYLICPSRTRSFYSNKEFYNQYFPRKARSMGTHWEPTDWLTDIIYIATFATIAIKHSLKTYQDIVWKYHQNIWKPERGKIIIQMIIISVCNHSCSTMF